MNLTYLYLRYVNIKWNEAYDTHNEIVALNKFEGTGSIIFDMYIVTINAFLIWEIGRAHV